MHYPHRGIFGTNRAVLRQALIYIVVTKKQNILRNRNFHILINEVTMTSISRVNQVQNENLQKIQAQTSISSQVYSPIERIKEAIKDEIKAEIIQNQKQENTIEQKKEEQQDEEKITQREQAQDEENVVFEQIERQNEENQQPDFLSVVRSDPNQSNVNTVTNVDYGAEFRSVEQRNAENVNQSTIDTQKQKEIFDNQFMNETNLQIQRESNERREHEALDKLSMLKKKEQQWSFKPEYNSYCGLSEDNQIYLAKELKNPFGDCQDFEKN